MVRRAFAAEVNSQPEESFFPASLAESCQFEIVHGGYARTVKHLGTFPLRPGTHDLELRDPTGQTIFQDKVGVLAGKTIKLAA